MISGRSVGLKIGAEVRETLLLSSSIFQAPDYYLIHKHKQQLPPINILIIRHLLRYHVGTAPTTLFYIRQCS